MERLSPAPTVVGRGWRLAEVRVLNKCAVRKQEDSGSGAPGIADHAGANPSGARLASRRSSMALVGAARCRFRRGAGLAVTDLVRLLPEAPGTARLYGRGPTSADRSVS
jgi:hypothetical protein